MTPAAKGLFITNVAMDNVQSDADRNNDTTPMVMFPIPFISQETAARPQFENRFLLTTNFHEQENR